MTKRRIGLWLAVAVVAILLLVAPAFEFASKAIWVCEVTGSVKHHDTSWFSLVDEEWFDPSPLETHLQNESPGQMEHRWVWLCRTGYYVLGGRSYTDSFRPTFGLEFWVNSLEFADLPDDQKTMIHDVLVQTKTWTDEQKQQLYDRLLKLQGKELRAFIDSSWEKMKRGQDEAHPQTDRNPGPPN